MVAARFGGIVGNIVIASLLDMYCPAPTFIVAALLIGKYHWDIKKFAIKIWLDFLLVHIYCTTARECVVIVIINIEFLGTYLSLLESLESRPVFKEPFDYMYLCRCCMQTQFNASIDAQEVLLKTCEN